MVAKANNDARRTILSQQVEIGRKKKSYAFLVLHNLELELDLALTEGAAVL